MCCTWLVGPAGSGEEILHAELDLGRLRGEFQHVDAVGHYNRPDLFSFSVDRTPLNAVDWT
jgi:nitrilase